MLKRIILVCIGAVFAISAMAQVTVNRTEGSSNQHNNLQDTGSAFVLKYGVKAGVNASTMSNAMSFDPGFQMGIGFRIGGFLNMRWGQRTENSLPGTGVWGFQPELLYSNQAVTTEGGDIRMNYVSVPMLLKIYPTTGLSIEVGPEFSYLLATAPATVAAGGTEIAIGECKGLVAGVAAGIAYDFESGFTVGARYTYGMTDMASNLKWKNSNIQITVGWMF